MNLTITLSEQEFNDILGWVNYYAANPQYIGVKTGVYLPTGPNYQTRIVLEEQTASRYAEIAAQFAPAPAEVIPYVRNDPDGSGSFVFWAQPGTNYAVEVPVPAGTGVAGGGVASIPTGGIPLEGKFSQTAGDFVGAQTGPNPSYTAPNPATGMHYFNVRLALGWSQAEQLRMFCNPTPP